MPEEPYLLDDIRRNCVLESIDRVCIFRCWTLLACHVRTNHVHVVVRANCPPERVMTALKAYASRALNGLELHGPNQRRWARHGSTRYLWTREAVRSAIHYVVHEQGEPMAVYERIPSLTLRVL